MSGFGFLKTASRAAIVAVVGFFVMGCSPTNENVLDPPSITIEEPELPVEPIGLDIDQACDEIAHFRELLYEADLRGVEATEDENFALNARISENKLELLAGLDAIVIQDEDLANLVSQYVSAAVEFERYFFEQLEVVETYGANSDEHVAHWEAGQLVLEDWRFRLSQLDSACGFN